MKFSKGVTRRRMKRHQKRGGGKKGGVEEKNLRQTQRAPFSSLEKHPRSQRKVFNIIEKKKI